MTTIVQVINATIETEDGLLVPVKLIDCDSVSQAKEKMLDAVFKVRKNGMYNISLAIVQ